MNTDAILSFQAPARDGARVSAHASPVLELAYAHFFLLERLGDDPSMRLEMPWLSPLLEQHADLVDALRSFGPPHGLLDTSAMLLLLAARYGFDRHDDPERFLRELPGLPARCLADGWVDEGGDEERASSVHGTMARLTDEVLGERLGRDLERLWRAIGPGWEREGRAAVDRAVAEFRTAFERSGSVLEALPPHHFTRFEELATGIREAEAHRRVVVVPLYLASSGGFNFLVDDVHYVGFGLGSESAFERSAHRLADLAQRAKVLGDPTRLMVLVLVGRFASMHLTVGDLARQLGVSQPTVSGHLKLLRQAGLVAPEKRGTKTYHRLDRGAARNLLDDLGRSLLD